MLWTLLLIYILPFLLLTILVEAEWFGMATSVMLASMGIYGFLHRMEIFPYIKEHGLFCLEFIGIYVILGIVWSFAKWFLFLMKFRNKFRDAKVSYVLSLGLLSGDDVPTDKLDAFKRTLSYEHVSGYPLTKRPEAAQFKSKIVAWMAFWPCSVIGYIFNDPVRRLFNALFIAFRDSYQKMSDKIINDPELK